MRERFSDKYPEKTNFNRLSYDMFSRTIIRSGYLSNEECKKLYERYITIDWTDRAYSLLSHEQVLRTLTHILPSDRRLHFCCDEKCITSLNYFHRKLKDPEIDDIRINELYVLGHAPNNSPAALMACYLDYSNDKDVLDWFNKSQARVDVGHGRRDSFRKFLSSRNFQVTMLVKLFKDEKRDVVFEKLTPDQFYQVFLFSPIRHELVLDTLLEDKSALDSISKMKKNDGWKEKILNMQRYFANLNTSRVEDWDLNRAIFLSYINSYPEQTQALAELFERAPHQEFLVISRLRNSLTEEKLQQMRDALVKSGETRTVDEHLEKWSNRLDSFSISEKESPHYPLAHLIPTCGYEIEHIPKKIDRQRFAIVERLGFTEGTGSTTSEGYYEVSPGPFQHPDTANLVFLSYIQSGYVDLYKEQGQSVHYNIQLLTGKDNDEYGKLLQATAYAYYPRFQDSSYGSSIFSSGTHTARINNNKNIFTGEPYQEFKDFSLLTVRGFMHHMRQGVYAGAALKAYQKFDLYSDDNMDQKPYGVQKYAILGSQHLSLDEKRLALIWLHKRFLLSQGFKSANLHEVLQLNTPKPIANEFASQIKKVYPNISSFYYRNPDEIIATPVKAGKREFPNIVSFSRALLRSTYEEVDGVLNKSEEEFKQALEKIFNGSFTSNWKLVNNLFERYPCGLRTETKYKDKVEVLKKLREIYISK